MRNSAHRNRPAPVALLCALGTTIVLGACLSSPAVECADGRLCPSTKVCDDIHHGCVLPGQLTSCDELDELDECTIEGEIKGVCRDGVCLFASCGDGLVLGLEQCDGLDLGGKTDCRELGFSNPGPLGCSANCTYDVSACSGLCGDGEISGSEACDPGAPLTKTCLDFGFYAEAGLGCSLACTFDVGDCIGFCGDGELNGGELCDGAPPTAPSCVALGFDAGAPRCTNFCGMSDDVCATFGFREETVGGDVQLWGIDIAPSGELFAVGADGKIFRRSNDEWAPMTSPTTEFLRDVWIGDDSFAIAAGENGTIVRFDGTSWMLESSAATTHLADVWGTGPTNVYVVGDGGAIVHFDGTSWTVMPSGTTRNLRGVWGAAADDIWAGGLFGEMLHFDGTQWTKVAQNATNRDFQSLWGTSADDIWAVLTFGEIAHYDGTSWASVPSPTTNWLRDVKGTSASDVFASGEGGGLIRYDGATWKQVNTGTTDEIKEIALQGTALWAAGDRSLVLSANTVLDIKDAPGTNVVAIAGLSADSLLAVGGGGTAKVQSLSGWTGVNIGAVANQILHGATELEPGHFVVVGGAGQIIERRNGVWGSMASPTTATLRAVWGASPTAIYAVGDGGVIVRSDGNGWTIESAPVTAHLRGVWGASDDRVFAVGDAGVILERVAGAWATVSSGTIEQLEAISGTAADDLWAVGWNGSALHFDGSSWTATETGTSQPLLAVASAAPDDVLAVGQQGAIRHFDGLAWRPATSALTTHTGLWMSGRHIYLASADGGRHLERRRLWHCPEAGGEQSCGDNTDNDCDGLTDGDDPDCLGAVVVSEIHLGVDVAYVEIRGERAGATSLEGLEVARRGACDSATVRHRLPVNAVVGDGEVWRAVDRTTSWQVRESAGSGLCGTPSESMWVALCAGRCDLDACSNFLDYVETSSGAAPQGAPACASMMGGPVNVAAAGTDALTRVGVTGVGATGNSADWALAPPTRD